MIPGPDACLRCRWHLHGDADGDRQQRCVVELHVDGEHQRAAALRRWWPVRGQRGPNFFRSRATTGLTRRARGAHPSDSWSKFNCASIVATVPWGKTGILKSAPIASKTNRVSKLLTVKIAEAISGKG